MIHHVFLVAENDDDPELVTEPPERMLRVDVIAGVAVLSVHQVLPSVGEPSEESVGWKSSVGVSATSLVRALQMLMADQDDEEPAAWRRLPDGEGLMQRRGRAGAC